MTVYDYFLLMREVRERFDVAGFNLDGINLWPLFRLLLFFAHQYKHLPALSHLEGGRPVVPPGRTRPGAIFAPGSHLTEDLGDARLWLPPGAECGPDILVLQAHTDYTLRHGPDLADPLYLGIRQAFGPEVSVAFLCDWHPGPAGGAAVTAAGLYYQPLWRAARPSGAGLAWIMAQAADWCGYCNARLGEPTITPLDLLAWLQRMLGLIPAFTRLFTRIAPRVVVLQGAVDIDKFAAVIAARRLGIPVADHQHGVYTHESELYISWIEVPKGVIDPTPRVFWMWSEHFYRALPPATATVAKLVSGDLRLLPPIRREQLDLPYAARRILYLHQGLAGDMSLLPNVVMDAVRASPPDWQWLIRLHPRSLHQAEPLTRYFAARGLDNVLVDLPSRASLHSCLDAADVAVTGYSTAGIEANEEGVPVIVHEPLGEIMFREALAAGAMASAATGKELLRAAAAARRPALRMGFTRRSPELAREALKQTLELSREG